MTFDDLWAERVVAERNQSTLIFSCTHLKTDRDVRFFEVQQKLLERLNPGVPRLVVDSASPIPSWTWFAAGFNLFQFPDALGHPGKDPDARGDGPGRAIMKGLEIAITEGFKRAVYAEADALVATPVEWGFRQLTKPIGLQPRCQHGFLDTQMIWFGDLAWLKEFDFISKYDWPNQRRVHDGDLLYEGIPGPDNIQVLPHRGGRVDPPVQGAPWPTDHLTAENLVERFPDGIDYITHGSDELNAQFLRVNGHGDLVEFL